MKLLVYKYNVSLGPKDQFRDGYKKAAILNFKKNIVFERAKLI